MNDKSKRRNTTRDKARSQTAKTKRRPKAKGTSTLSPTELLTIPLSQFLELPPPSYVAWCRSAPQTDAALVDMLLDLISTFLTTSSLDEDSLYSSDRVDFLFLHIFSYYDTASTRIVTKYRHQIDEAGDVAKSLFGRMDYDELIAAYDILFKSR